MYYHGTSDALGIGHKLLPPSTTGRLQEAGRLKNLDAVFFSRDLGSARVYAGRACRRFGGRPVIYRVMPMGEVVEMNSTPGTTVYLAPWAFVEEL